MMLLRGFNGQVTPQPSLIVCEHHVRTKDNRRGFSHDNPILQGVDHVDLPYLCHQGHKDTLHTNQN